MGLENFPGGGAGVGIQTSEERKEPREEATTQQVIEMSVERVLRITKPSFPRYLCHGLAG